MTADHAGRTTAAPQSESGDGADVEDVQDDRTLIARTAAARRSGQDVRADVDELLRRAARRNRAALDRLAR